MRVIQKALTFDDVLLVPAHSTVLPRDVSLQSQVTRRIRLNIPLVSAAMDTVTESRLAIALAQEGGIGVVHKNFTPAEQAAEVHRVKRHESGILKDPITIPPTMTVGEVIAIQRENRFSGVPVIDRGRVVGIVTNRDTRFETNLDQPVSQIMTPQARLVTVREGASLEEARELLRVHRLERVLVMNEAGEMCGLITVKDMMKATEHPFAAKDEHGRLRVGAAIGVGAGTEERAERLAEAGVDMIVVDTAHGHSQGVLDRVNWVKKNFPQIEVVGGNIDKLVPEGIEGRVPYKGAVGIVIHQLIGGLRASMGYLGCEDIPALHDRAQFVEISSAGMRESHVHDVQITKEAPNYQIS